VIVALTAKGKALQDEAAAIPHKLTEGLVFDAATLEDLQRLKDQLHAIIQHLSNHQP